MEPISTAEDRISQLPDSILHLILAKDRTRHAVQTMVLSKRWERLWASTPYLLLDDYKDHLGSSEGMPNFIEFVNAALLLRDMSAVHTFRLTWHFSYDQKWLIIWTEYVIRRNVKVLEIDLDIGDIDVEKWPSCIFTCRSLEKLSLKLKDSVHNVSMDLSPLENVRFGQLKLLHIECSSADHVSLKKLLEGCPILEELEMIDCLLKDIDIFSHTLQRLCIMCCEITGTMVRFSCPNLTDLVFLGNEVELQEIVLEDLSSMRGANIQTDDCGLRLIFSRVPEPLMFFDSASENASRNSGPLEFPKLTNLILTGDHMSNGQAIIHFLERAPNLELLRLKYLSSCGVGHKWWYQRPHVTLEVQSECGNEDEEIFLMVSEFLGAVDDDDEESGESG